MEGFLKLLPASKRLSEDKVLSLKVERFLSPHKSFPAVPRGPKADPEWLNKKFPSPGVLKPGSRGQSSYWSVIQYTASN